MKFFEIHEPYYALLKAETEEQAIKKYTEVVADNDPNYPLEEEIKAVPRDYALARFSQAPSEDKKLLPVSEVVDVFNAREVEVMIIDGSLI